MVKKNRTAMMLINAYDFIGGEMKLTGMFVLDHISKHKSFISFN